MSAEEKNDKLLSNFSKMQDFLDILRKVEEENYYIIQETQEIEKDQSDEQNKFQAMKDQLHKELHTIDCTLKRLDSEKKKAQEKLRAKRAFMKSNELNNPQDANNDNSDEEQKFEEKEDSSGKKISLEELLSTRIKEVFDLNVGDYELILGEHSQNIEMMRCIEQEFDKYYLKFEIFRKEEKKKENDLNEIKKLFSEYNKTTKLKQPKPDAIKQMALDKEKAKQEKDKLKVKKRKGRYDMCRIFIRKNKKKEVKVELNQEHQDDLLYFT